MGQLWVKDSTTTTGIKEQFLSQLHIFPNPSTDIIHIQSTYNEQLLYDIYNSLGEIVSTGNCFNQIDVSKLPIGPYLLFLKDKNNRKLTTNKFLKE
jgi:hypothetical protein